MIYYNMRYRGPYEYDKFVLNTLQYNNMTNCFLEEINEDVDYLNLKAIKNDIDKLFDYYVQEHGLCESIYKNLLLFKEVK